MILVVGASGKLGSIITSMLLAQEESIRILTRNSPGYQPHIDAGAEPVSGDLKDPASLKVACAGVDIVISTATAAERWGEDSLETVDLDGVGNLITAAKEAGVKKFIYVSSSAADPNSDQIYFKAKGTNVQRLMESGIDYAILSPHVFLDVWLGVAFGLPLQNQQPITLVGKGDHQHSFIAIQDVAAFVVAAIDHPDAHNQNILIGGPAPISFMDIANAVGKALGIKLQVNFVNPGDPIPLIPEPLWGFLYLLESFEMKIDMADTAQKFAITLTDVETLAGQMFAS